MTVADATPLNPMRVVDGVELPVPGQWIIDAGHSCLAFEARHATITTMRGRFRSFSGTFSIGDLAEASAVELTIDAASIDTTNDLADASLRGEHFLDVEHHPHLQFRSTSVHHVGERNWLVGGDLTIRGITRPIMLEATFGGAVAVARNARAKMAFSARGQFDRRDFGIDANFALPAGGWVVGTGVRLALDVEADLPLEAGT